MIYDGWGEAVQGNVARHQPEEDHEIQHWRSLESRLVSFGPNGKSLRKMKSRGGEADCWCPRSTVWELHSWETWGAVTFCGRYGKPEKDIIRGKMLIGQGRRSAPERTCGWWKAERGEAHADRNSDLSKEPTGSWAAYDRCVNTRAYGSQGTATWARE